MTLQQRIERMRRQAQNGVISPGELICLLDDLSTVVQAHEARMDAALASLSYSELIMVRRLVDALPEETGGVIVASRIADSCLGTRSVVVQALRKLAAAGLVTVRSLGQKGTHVRLHGITRTDLLQRLGGAA